jgi:hypothetical protein
MSNVSGVRRRRLVATFGAALVMVTISASCARKAASGPTPSATESTPTESPTPTPSPSPSPTPVETPTASPTPSATPLLPDGRHFGRINEIAIGDSGTELVFNLQQFLMGEEARQAAIADGVLKPGEELPNDYYIRDQNPKLRNMPLADDAKIRIVNWENCCDLIDGERDPWLAAFAPGADHFHKYHGQDSPYWLTVQNGIVVMVEEQYLP